MVMRQVADVGGYALSGEAASSEVIVAAWIVGGLAVLTMIAVAEFVLVTQLRHWRWRRSIADAVADTIAPARSQNTSVG